MLVQICGYPGNATVTKTQPSQGTEEGRDEKQIRALQAQYMKSPTHKKNCNTGTALKRQALTAKQLQICYQLNLQILEIEQNEDLYVHSSERILVRISVGVNLALWSPILYSCLICFLFVFLCYIFVIPGQSVSSVAVLVFLMQFWVNEWTV